MAKIELPPDSSWKWITESSDKYKGTLEDIKDILHDYDGYNNAANLKKLIDEVIEIINASLKDN
jgi:hypothetical protein